MSENTTVEQRLDRIERLLRGQKTVLNFAEACEFTGLSKTYMYKLTHQGRIPHFKPHGKNIYFNREELEPVATAKSCQDGRTERTRSRRLRRRQTTTEVAFHPACSGTSGRVGFSIN